MNSIKSFSIKTFILFFVILLWSSRTHSETPALSGLWYDPALDGEGYNIIVSPVGNIIIFYGHTTNNQRLWLISDLITQTISFNQSINNINMLEIKDGNFDMPVTAAQGGSNWGTLNINFQSCNQASFTLSGSDGEKTSHLQLLAGIQGTQCDVSKQCIGTGTKPDCFPNKADVNLYQANSIWNQVIGDDVVLASNQSDLLQSLIDSGNMVVQVKQYSAPVYVVDNQSPKVNVDIACSESFGLGIQRLVHVPIPSYAQPSNDIDGANNPIPATACGEDSDQDNHMLILDLENRCEYGLWQARKNNGQWIASLATAYSMDGNGIFAGGISSRGSGFPFLAGMIWPDELANGVINHALAFSYPFSKSGGPVAPATASDGITNSNKAIPMGAHVRLDPSLDLNTLSLSSYEKTIATAMQTYGMYLVDTGGSSTIGLYAIDPQSIMGDMYAGILPDVDFVPLDNIPIERMQILSFGSQNPNASNEALLANDACSMYE